jgi:hypothetical protein
MITTAVRGTTRWALAALPMLLRSGTGDDALSSRDRHCRRWSILNSSTVTTTSYSRYCPKWTIKPPVARPQLAETLKRICSSSQPGKHRCRVLLCPTFTRILKQPVNIGRNEPKFRKPNRIKGIAGFGETQSDAKRRCEPTQMRILSPVRLPFRHTGNPIRSRVYALSKRKRWI